MSSSSSSPSLPLAGKVALITGGSNGIGRAIAFRLARDGAKVVINYASNSKAANEVVETIGAKNCIAIQADAGNINSIDMLVDKTLKEFGRIDILIPAAGVLLNKDLENVTEEDYEKTMSLNVKGPLFLAKKAAPHMAPGSSIIFFSTSLCVASTITPNYLIYAASKGAIEQMVHVMSKDLFRKGIAVNAIAPGPTGTSMFYEGKNDNVLKMIAGFSPAQRIGTPDEISDAVAFLSGTDSKWVSGQILRVNGGMA